ncbi:MAG TPA: hypothetical protein VMP68_02020 [Candidatus Eisenbacteria bacterium]|nr:hypothetical protein [Candidatus Eisenbacteria bacterium]
MRIFTSVSSLIGALCLVGFSFGGRPSAAKPFAPQKAASAVKLTSQQADDLNHAWKHLARAYMDLMTVAPDVKGDTSRLENALKAAIHNIHQLEPSLAEASGFQGQDRGQPRERVFDAVQKHLDVAKEYLGGAHISNPNAEQALAQITTAYAELKADRAAPVKK